MQIPLKDKHPVIQLLAFIGLSVASLIVVMLLGMIVGVSVWGPEFIDSFQAQVNDQSQLMYLKYIQILSHLGMFIVPAFIFGWLAGGNTIKYFTLDKNAKFSLFLLAIAIIIFSQPLINLLTEWNNGLTLPKRFSNIEQWMKESEEQAAVLTNVFMMAVIPAIGEELVFRGVLQKLLIKWFKMAWVAIILTAIIFSAFHMQFYGFVPRVVLGLILGYCFYVTGKLWISITIHFINNAMAVTVYWLYNKEVINIAPEEFSNFNNNLLLLSISIFLLAISVYIFVINANTKKSE